MDLSALLSLSNILAGIAGLTADANSLVNYARTQAQNHLLAYNEDIPVETLVQRMCDLKQVSGPSSAPLLLCSPSVI